MFVATNILAILGLKNGVSSYSEKVNCELIIIWLHKYLILVLRIIFLITEECGDISDN